jgi:penicillin-binding protein 2
MEMTSLPTAAGRSFGALTPVLEVFSGNATVRAMPSNRFTTSIVALALGLPLSAQQPEGVSSIRRTDEPEVRKPVVISRGQPAARPPIIGSAPANVPVMSPPSPPPVIAAAPPPVAPVVIQPTWETQKLARSYTFTIPAPRGQITDRNGTPLAQNKIAQNLAIIFPTPPKFTDAEAQRFIADQVATATRLLGRPVVLDADKGLKHYKNRGIVPLVIAIDLKPTEIASVQRANPAGLVLQSVYQRVYPQGRSAGHIVGYVGRVGNPLTGPVETNELLWPQVEGREGLELTFNEQLTGKNGAMFVSFDAQGRKSEERIVTPPTPGQNVITTIDLKIQKAVESSLASANGHRPCAMSVMDCTNGEILAMASVPNYDPNVFIPTITQDELNVLNDPNNNNPLIPRAFRSAYPLGSVFKVFTGLAAMNEGKVDPDDEFGGEAYLTIDGRKFWDHTKRDTGPKNFIGALTMSCNTYFYRMGLKAGFAPITDYARKLGFASRTGIPINGEEDGGLNDVATILAKEGRQAGQGDLANLAIGQGQTNVTPLQVSKAMCAIANGGTVYQPRLVLQVQSVDDKVSIGYDVRVRHQFTIDKETMSALRKGMLSVVYGKGGTAHPAQVPNLKIAGKTGTAQWGKGAKERVAAWFGGYAPAEKPQWAFAAVYEGKPGDDSIHGGTNVGPIISKALAKFPKPEPDDKEGGLRKKKNRKNKDSEEKMDAGDDDATNDTPPPRPRRRRSAESEEVVQ